MSVDYFSVFLLTFSSMKIYFQCPCTTHDIAAHRPIFAVLLPLPLPTNQAQCKKNGEKPSCFFDSSVILLTIFKSNCCFWGERLICDYISAHRHILPGHLRHPLALIKTDQGRKKNGNHCILMILQFLYSPFLITLLQLVQMCDL